MPNPQPAAEAPEPFDDAAMLAMIASNFASALAQIYTQRDDLADGFAAKRYSFLISIDGTHLVVAENPPGPEVLLRN